jgi:hypothetical protein
MNGVRSGRGRDALGTGPGRVRDTNLTLFFSRESGLFRDLCAILPILRKKFCATRWPRFLQPAVVEKGRFKPVMDTQYRGFLI